MSEGGRRRRPRRRAAAASAAAASDRRGDTVSARSPRCAGVQPQAAHGGLAVRLLDRHHTGSSYWFNNHNNIGEGIRAMLTVRMAQSNTITLLERSKIQEVMKEQDFGGVQSRAQGHGGQDRPAVRRRRHACTATSSSSAATTRRSGRERRRWSAGFRQGGWRSGRRFNKEEKAVVGINLRLVDTETGEVIETAEARGESSR